MPVQYLHKGFARPGGLLDTFLDRRGLSSLGPSEPLKPQQILVFTTENPAPGLCSVRAGSCAVRAPTALLWMPRAPLCVPRALFCAPRALFYAARAMFCVRHRHCLVFLGSYSALSGRCAVHSGLSVQSPEYPVLLAWEFCTDSQSMTLRDQHSVLFGARWVLCARTPSV